MCGAIKDKTQDEQFTYFLNYVNQSSAYEYGAYYLKNETFAVQVIIHFNSERCWSQGVVLSKLYGVWILANAIIDPSIKTIKNQYRFLQKILF